MGDEHYVKALSLSRVAVDVEAVAAPAVAGVLVALLGVRWVFWFDAFTYLVSALLVAAATVPHVAKALAPLPVRDVPGRGETTIAVVMAGPGRLSSPSPHRRCSPNTRRKKSAGGLTPRTSR